MGRHSHPVQYGSARELLPLAKPLAVAARLPLNNWDMNVIEISTPHLKMADQYLRDSQSDTLSLMGRVDSALDAGYFCLLSILTRAEREHCDHPSASAIDRASERLGVDPEESKKFMCARYSLEQRPNFSDALRWASDVRAAVSKLQEQ